MRFFKNVECRLRDYGLFVGFLLCAIVAAGCVTAKDYLGAAYQIDPLEYPILKKDYDAFLKALQSGKVYCAHYHFGFEVRCGAFVEADPARISAIVSNPYFSSSADSPLVPRASPGQRHTKFPVQFRYHAHYDATKSNWGYVFRISPGGYRGSVRVYSEIGEIETWETRENRCTRWSLNRSADARKYREMDEHLYIDKIEFRIAPALVEGKQGTLLSVEMMFNSSHPFRCNCPEHDDTKRMVEIGLDNLYTAVRELIEAIAAITRLSGDTKIDIAEGERTKLLPPEFVSWEKEMYSD